VSDEKIHEGNGEVPSFKSRQPDKPFKVDGVSYLVVELDDKDVAWWVDANAKRVKINSKGKIVGRDILGLQEALIQRGIRDHQGGKVPRATIDRWGPKTKAGVFMMVQDHSGLGANPDEADEEEAKNSEPGASSTGASESQPASA
jgi:hypothetical protein